jgi:hypothetical protein
MKTIEQEKKMAVKPNGRFLMKSFIKVMDIINPPVYCQHCHESSNRTPIILPLYLCIDCYWTLFNHEWN